MISDVLSMSKFESRGTSAPSIKHKSFAEIKSVKKMPIKKEPVLA